MKFSVAAVLAAAAGAQANYVYQNATTSAVQAYVTEVVSVLTTYCPEATEITQGGKTYTVSSATTLTITDCPCTVSKPVYTTAVVECKTCNATQPAPTTAYPVGTVTPVVSKPPTITGAAGKVAAPVAGLVGLAALLL